jgi:hypothetical protein
MGNGNPQVSSITRELSAYIAHALKKPIPKDVSEIGKHHLLDTLAAIVSGSRLLPGRKAIAYVRNLGRREASFGCRNTHPYLDGERRVRKRHDGTRR